MKFSSAFASSISLSLIASKVSGNQLEVGSAAYDAIFPKDVSSNNPSRLNRPLFDTESFENYNGGLGDSRIENHAPSYSNMNSFAEDTVKVVTNPETRKSEYNFQTDKEISSKSNEFVRPPVKRLQHSHHVHHEGVEKRNNNFDDDSSPVFGSTLCKFPTGVGLIAVTPDKLNAGWAMSPDQPCLPGKYCPYACPPGQVMAQWDPSATSYSYPISMNGGLYCDGDGNIHRPFPDKPYCVPGTGTSAVRNFAASVVSFCQTVLPGNEAMLIPTEIKPGFSEILAVPDMTYWLSTAAHYYINAPGVPASEACVWGTNDNPVGNWSPYVAGANTDASGKTFVKLGWNPVYLEQTCSFRNNLPNFGVRLVCEGNCQGIPCAIDPSVQGVNEVDSRFSSVGAGNGAFCVATAEQGSKIHIEVFEIDNDTDTPSKPNPQPIQPLQPSQPKIAEPQINVKPVVSAKGPNAPSSISRIPLLTIPQHSNSHAPITPTRYFATTLPSPAGSKPSQASKKPLTTIGVPGKNKPSATVKSPNEKKPIAPPVQAVYVVKSVFSTVTVFSQQEVTEYKTVDQASISTETDSPTDSPSAGVSARSIDEEESDSQNAQPTVSLEPRSEQLNNTKASSATRKGFGKPKVVILSGFVFFFSFVLI